MNVCPVAPHEWLDHALPSVVSVIAWNLDLSCCPDFAMAPLAVQQRAKAAAVDALNTITLGQFAQCERTIRICPDCGCPPSDCCSCEWQRIDLSHYVWPLNRIVAVEVTDGAGVTTVLPPSDYRIDNARYITPTKGGGLMPWPPQSSLNFADGEPDTWLVRIVDGEPVPELVLQAAADLACQLVNWCLNKPCDIPSNATTIRADGMWIKLDTGVDMVPAMKLVRELYGRQKRVRTGIFDPAEWKRRRVAIH